MTVRRFVDRGGTFTDIVEVRPGEPPRASKVRSDAVDLSAFADGELVFGTTVATNALLEGRGVRTALVVTAGLADLVHLRTMARPALFDPDQAWPASTAQVVIEVEGRLGPDGAEIEPVSVPADLATRLADVDAVAVALLHSPRNPAHELAIAAAIAAVRPDVSVSLGHRVCPEVGYLARIETTLVDASVTPLLQAALARDGVPTTARAIRSDGTLVPVSELRAPDAVLSGPAGGVLAVAAVARALGAPGAVGLDMGGTSTDVCLVVGQELPRRDAETWVGGHALRRPSLEVLTIAAGGGSVLWHDGVRLRVGPHSAGAHPGPQVYGRGGPPTVTDASVSVGDVDVRAFVPPLSPGCIALPAPAEAFLAVAREEMARAVRSLATARGVDVAALPLVAFGGAAGQHAAAVAERLGVNTVIVHPLAAALSAWGQTLASEAVVAVRAVWRPLDDVASQLGAWIDALARDAVGARQATVALRPVGTDFSLDVAWAGDAGDLRRAFGRVHASVFGFSRAEARLEVVSLRVAVSRPPAPVPAPADDPFGLGGRTVRGPVRLDCPTTSVVVPEGWEARRAHGVLRLTRVEVAAAPAWDTSVTPAGLALWASRFVSVAEEAGERLARLARSVSIRERRDFSCAVFDGGGQLVANAPHVPVHLGAMGETVRDLIAHVEDLPDGSAWLTNDPQAGGSHLPDMTVVTVVWHGDHRFFVACRAHHADVGGITPGSMPPRSTRLAEEGLVFTRVRLDGPARDALDLSGSRLPGVVRADLDAQLAANRLAAARLVALGPAHVLAAWMAHQHDAADALVGAALRGLPVCAAAEDVVDGVRLALRSTCDGERLTLDFTGTGGPHAGNLNAPRGVVRAAVLYALRVVVGDDVPLVEGALRRVTLVLPPGSVLDPPPTSAVVGGNVETSQRVVDLLLRAWGRRAAGQGTMNNLTLGGDGWAFYETLGGGQGAREGADGVSGLQVHMTNTRATDVEVLETRLPLRVRRFTLRRGSGGAGRWRGGDGIVRELEVLAPCTAALLATRRDVGASGLAGGCAGAVGADQLVRADGEVAWDGAPTALVPGDRVRVLTPGGGGYGATVPDGAADG